MEQTSTVSVLGGGGSEEVGELGGEAGYGGYDSSDGGGGGGCKKACLGNFEHFHPP